jgi:hypothetical protein
MWKIERMSFQRISQICNSCKLMKGINIFVEARFGWLANLYIARARAVMIGNFINNDKTVERWANFSKARACSGQRAKIRPESTSL